ncbi:MAG: lysophospholipid acyltransferase family protein [Spirochaetaceae bacterium]
MAESIIGGRRKRRDMRRERRRIRALKPLNWILRKLVAVIFWWLFKLEAENLEIFESLKPPYVVLPNHQSAIDPFFVNRFVPAPIHYVVSDSNFRSRLLSFGLGLVGSIPKTKAVSDLETVKNIVKIKANRGIIGIYPEGQNTWDGATLPIIPSTAKLLKSLKVPVVIAKVQGAFLSMPRWARGIRRGRTRVSFFLGFTPADLKALTAEEIREKMAEHLAHDEFAFQKRVGWTFRSKHRAEYLEMVLFTCPECRKMNTLVSRGNNLRCGNCGYEVTVAPSGFFRRREGPLHFDTILAWNRWQIRELEKLLDEKREVFLSTPLFQEADMRLEKGYKSLPLRPLGTGELFLFSDKLVFVAADTGTAREFSVPEIEGINVQNGENLEFYYRDSLYKIRNRDRRGNSYKYYAAIRHLRRGFATPEIATP